MRIVVYARPSMAWQVQAADAFAEGLRRHGIEAVRRSPHENPIDCDLAVMWSNRFKNIQAHQRKAGKRYLIMERGYLGNREQWVSLGYDGLNGNADFVNKDVPSDRWDTYWKSRLGRSRSPLSGCYILVIGQVPGDSSLEDLPGSFQASFTEICNEARREFGSRLPVFWRPHPLCLVRGSAWTPEGFVTQPPETNLWAALANASGVITWNSTTGVESVLQGVPTIALSKGSMVYDIAQNRMVLEKLTNRNEWGRKIAYAQWTYKEIGCGDAWEHLKRGMNVHSPDVE